MTLDLLDLIKSAARQCAHAAGAMRGLSPKSHTAGGRCASMAAFGALAAISGLAHAQAVPRPGVAGGLPPASKGSVTDLEPRANVLADPRWVTGSGTPVLGDDGQYHLFYDRIPRNNGRLFRGWLYVSQIAHATSPTPQGPYKFQDIALQSPGDDPTGRWDAVNAGNASCVRLPDPDSGGKLRYYLYFIANRDTNNTFNDWYDHIINHRIGVAVADSPNGPWERRADPVCVPQSPLLGYVVNPAVTRLPGGKYLMVLKGRAANQNLAAGSDTMGNYRTGWALADKPTGPFTIQPSVILDTSGAAVEDPAAFMWNGVVYVAFKDARTTPSRVAWLYGTIGADGHTITWTVPSATDANYQISARQLAWSDGTTTTLTSLERPFILQDATGKPTHLTCIASVGDRLYKSPYPPTPLDPPPAIPTSSVTFNVCIPLLP